MSAIDIAFGLLKAPITYDEYPALGYDFPRYLYSGGHTDDDFRYFSKDPNLALGIALFGSAVPRKWFPDEESRSIGSRSPNMRQTVPRMKVLDTSMVGDDEITMFGSPYEAVLPSPQVSQRLEEIGALTDVPQSRLENNLEQIIDSERFNRKRYNMLRDTGVDAWGHEIDDDFEGHKRWLRERMPFFSGWWEFDNPDEPNELHPVYERLGMEWDPNALQDEMWWPQITNTSAGYHGSPHTRKDMLNHVKGALERLRTGIPGTVEIPPDQRKFYGIAENDDRPMKEGILTGWNA
jgi:hypothetical protein